MLEVSLINLIKTLNSNIYTICNITVIKHNTKLIFLSKFMFQVQLLAEKAKYVIATLEEIDSPMHTWSKTMCLGPYHIAENKDFQNKNKPEAMHK